MGAAVVLAMNGFAALELIRGVPHPNQGLITTGIVVGAWSVWMYTRWMLQFLRATPSAPARD